MTLTTDEEVIFTLNITPLDDREETFLNWKKKLNSTVAAFTGFISIEISLSPTNQEEWVIIQRFKNRNLLKSWRRSPEFQALMIELEIFADQEKTKQILSSSNEIESGITEVIVTRVYPGKEQEFREWMAKIHHMEAKFPGFRGAYVQSPMSGKGSNWITLLQFDSADNLDSWLSSKERKEVLEDSKALVHSLEQHRVISPYSGWFASVSSQGEIPPSWKQAMLVLLVLFPMVVLELKYLIPKIEGLGLSLSTFIGNAISVSLVTWPAIPLVIKGLTWWLTPGNSKSLGRELLGIGVVVALYLAEITLFWALFS